MVERSPRAAPRCGSPPWRAKVAWFQVTEDLRTQRFGGLAGARQTAYCVGCRKVRGLAWAVKENIRSRQLTGRAWGLAVY